MTSAAPSKPWSLAALGALGVVYGDLGTSPLYTLQTVVEATGGRFTAQSALGVLSLILWTLLITISVKYCVLVMRADNHGEGGILALMSLVGGRGLVGRARIFAFMGLLGAALLYGDGVITPAISVLSALEGVEGVTPALTPFVLPAAIAILLIFFAAQRYGTGKIGAAFGPVMLVWFIVIGLLGLSGIVRNPGVLVALDPSRAVVFLAHAGARGPLVLGGVFLCITGGEALYADMGHFGAGPIRLSWYTVVLPALLLSYAGQTALLIQKGVVQGNPFFLLAPAWSIYPLVGLATIATIIASQAIITGSFSMTRQAMQLGWLPGFSIRQTSDEVYGQIYVPVVNWLMMLATIGITLAFGSSSRLAGAYGTAVSTTMTLTTGLLFMAMRKVWKWPPFLCALTAGPLLVVDLTFFSANLLKVADGGWLPLTFGAVVFIIMLTWRWGIGAVHAAILARSDPAETLMAKLASGDVLRTPGTAVFLTRTENQIPPLMIDHVRHMGALHSNVIALTITFEETPRVARADRGQVEPLTCGVWRVELHYGFNEIPDIPAALRSLENLDPAIEIDKAIYFASRDQVTPKPTSRPLHRLRAILFAFLFRNAIRAVDRFRLPPRDVVEIAREIDI